MLSQRSAPAAIAHRQPHLGVAGCDHRTSHRIRIRARRVYVCSMGRVHAWKMSDCLTLRHPS